MITAQLFDSKLICISSPMNITSKEDIFRIVAFAQSKAHSVCIRWHNAENGHSGYWGLNGAQTAPHWFGTEREKRKRKTGAYKDPAKIRKGTSIFLSPEILSKLHNAPGRNSRIVEDALRFYWANANKFNEV